MLSRILLYLRKIVEKTKVHCNYLHMRRDPERADQQQPAGAGAGVPAGAGGLRGAGAGAALAPTPTRHPPPGQADRRTEAGRQTEGKRSEQLAV